MGIGMVHNVAKAINQAMTRDIFVHGFKLMQHQKDLKIFQRMASSVNLDVSLTNLTVSHYL